MTNDEDERFSTIRTVRVAAEADPSTLTRVLMAFQKFNVAPHRVMAEVSTTRVRVDIAGIPDERLTLMATKLGQLPTFALAYCYL